MKQQIIDAILNQEWLQITFQKEKDQEYVTRIVAPYDIFVQETGKHRGENRLIGYTKAHEDYKPGVISLYLNDITNLIGIGESFDGPTIRRLINPKKSPHIVRNW